MDDKPGTAGQVLQWCRAGGSKLVDGPAAFELWDTFGFPVDLTGLMAEEDGLQVDMPGYQAAMEAAREKSRAGGICTQKKLLCGIYMDFPLF